MDAYRDLADGDPIVLDSGADTEAGERAAAQFVAMTDRPTAIIAANDMVAFGLISALAAAGRPRPDGRLGRRFRRAQPGRALQPRPDHGPAADRRHGQHRDRPRREEGRGRIGRARRPAAGAAGAGLHRRAARMTARTDGELPRIPGVRYADHVAFTVPDLDEAVRFFVQALGAEELYRSTRGPEPEFMPEHFDVPAGCAPRRWRCCACRPTSTWSCSSGAAPTAAPSTRDTATPAGTTSASSSTTWTRRSRCSATSPACGCSATARRSAGDSPRVAGNRWIYFLTPWGLLMEIVDRSRVADPPALVGPADWRTAARRQHQKGPVTMRTCRPHPRNPGADRPGGARAVRGRRARRRRGDLPGRLPLGTAAARPALRRGGPAGVRGPGYPDRRADAVHDGDQRPRRRHSGGRRSTSSAAPSRSRRSWAPTGSASMRGRGTRATRTTRRTGTGSSTALRTLAPEASDAGVRLVRREPLRHHDAIGGRDRTAGARGGPRRGTGPLRPGQPDVHPRRAVRGGAAHPGRPGRARARQGPRLHRPGRTVPGVRDRPRRGVRARGALARRRRRRRALGRHPRGPRRARLRRRPLPRVRVPLAPSRTCPSPRSASRGPRAALRGLLAQPAVAESAR